MKGQAGGGAWYWIGSVVIGFGGLAWALSSGMKGAPCPACGDKHWQIAEGVIEACHQCEAYLMGDDKAVWLLRVWRPERWSCVPEVGRRDRSTCRIVMPMTMAPYSNQKTSY